MRKYIKQNLLQLCGSIIEIHDIILKEPNMENRVEYFILCQQSAVAIGDTFAKHATKTNEIDEKLEDFCNNLLPLAQMQQVTSDDLNKQNNLIVDVINIIESEEITYEVVFFPYSASMWDSMASVYSAFEQKQNYRCIVVPIPYRNFDKQTHQWKDCYEGDDFPSNLNKMHYSEYSVEKNAPEIAFIHNPYDEYNYITRVYEQYYSKAIKQFVDTLVYLPYYVTTGEFQQEHLILSAYNNVDYIIVQSKKIKEQFSITPFYDKVVALGSPKLDKIIKMCESGGSVPVEWEEKLKNKKVLMLNTTIGSFLRHRELLLNKLYSVFELIKSRSDVVIIWRPHPLLSATINSMVPDLRQQYDQLLDFFNQQSIGILDETPDLSNTIALSDAYIGDDGSSVLNLFGMANKPVFILNYYLNDIDEQQNTKLFCNQLTKAGNDFYTTSHKLNGVFKVNAEINSANLASLTADQTLESLYGFHVQYNGKIYLSPLASQYFYRFNVQKNKMDQLLNFNKPAQCMKVLRYKHKIIYLPQKNNTIIIYNTVNNKFSYKDFVIPPVSQNEIIYYDDSYNFAQIDKEVYIASNHSNIITCFNMEKETFTLHEIGPKTQSYIDVCFDGEYFWLAGVYNSEVVRYDKKSGETVCYPMPQDFVSWQNSHNRTLPHTGLYCYGDYVYTLPAFSNSMVKINKKTKEASLYMQHLFKKQITHKDMNKKPCYLQSLPIYKNGNQLVLQNQFDGEIFKIDLETDEVTHGYINLDKDSYERAKSYALGKSRGFYRRDLKETFCKRESNLFSFKEFITDLVTDGFVDIKPLQKQSLSEIAENLDGTCGEKTRDFVCDILDVDKNVL